MKFFLVLALVGLAAANLDYGNNRGTLVFGGQRSYGGSRGASASYGGGRSLGLVSGGLSGLSLGGGYSSGGYSSRGYSSGLSSGSGLSGLSLGNGGYSSGLSLGGGYSGGSGSNVLLAVPVAIASQQQVAVQSAPVASYGQYASVASQQQVSGPIQAAIQSTRNVEVVDVQSTGGYAAPQSVIIGPSVQPLDIEFQSQSSPVSVRQTHIPGQANEPQFSRHEEQPDYLKQEIVKPVVHEVTEAIQPYRRVTQEVRPVQETISQLITRGQQQQQQIQSVAASQLNVAQPSYSLQAVNAQPIAVSVQAQPSIALQAVQPISLTSGGYSSGLSSGSGLSGLSLGGGYSSRGYSSGLSSGNGGYSSGLSLGGGYSGAGLGVSNSVPSYSLNIQNLNKPVSSGLGLSGSSSYSSQPSISLGSLRSSGSYGSSYGSSLGSSSLSSLSAPDNYRS